MKTIFLVVGTAVLLLGFQNCGSSPSGFANSGSGPAGNIIASTSNVDKLVYTPADSSMLASKTTSPISIDLESGQESIGTQSCTLDMNRLSAFRNLLVDATVCEPAPLPPGSAECMAIGIPDIKLEGQSGSIQLRPVICNNGVYLCGDRDQQLRTLLQDLIQNPPPGC